MKHKSLRHRKTVNAEHTLPPQFRLILGNRSGFVGASAAIISEIHMLLMGYAYNFTPTLS